MFSSRQINENFHSSWSEISGRLNEAGVRGPVVGRGRPVHQEVPSLCPSQLAQIARTDPRP